MAVIKDITYRDVLALGCFANYSFVNYVSIFKDGIYIDLSLNIVSWRYNFSLFY